jgi:NodT family efflux transporter outer membrane factor (OMF) lipoprotein
LPAAWQVPEGFKFATPGEARLPADWWQLYGDRTLTELEALVEPANQTLAVADAQYRQALASAASARSTLSPTLTLTASASRSQQPVLTSGGGLASPPASNLYITSGQASWEPDLWGSVHANVAAAEASAAASFDQRAAVLLSLQAQLAIDYFQLRVADASIGLLTDTAGAYEQTLALVRRRHDGGVVTLADVTQADNQLQTARAALADARINRAVLEHAIAVLIGKTPGSFGLPPADWKAPEWPTVPLALPSTLLERRPDVASAERQVDAAADKISATRAAFFPVVTLSAQAGLESKQFRNWLSLPKGFWSIGPQLTQYLLDGGNHLALEQQALATLDQVTANYRQVVLESFQAVEDNLSNLDWLEEEQARQQAGVAAARQTLAIVTRQYQAGTVAYLNVISAQTSLLNAESAVLNLDGRKAVAHVQLVKALGGGWVPPTSDPGKAALPSR